jgi:zinc protease
VSVQTTSESNTHAPQAETFRRNHPAPLKPRPLKIPAAVESRLDNGLRIAIVRDARLPMVSFRLAFRGGDSSDPAELPGLSDMMAHLLTEGTADRTSLQIAEEVERLGATLSVSSASDFATIAASSLAVYADEILALMADVTLHPSFPQNEIDLARENTKQMLIQQRAQPNFLASERVAKVMFGQHPYARHIADAGVTRWHDPRYIHKLSSKVICSREGCAVNSRRRRSGRDGGKTRKVWRLDHGPHQ